MSCNSIVPSFSKDFGKKKKTNRSAKLKQCKMDARREQWLSQVKGKGCKEESKEEGGSPHLLEISKMVRITSEEKEKGCKLQINVLELPAIDQMDNNMSEDQIFDKDSETIYSSSGDSYSGSVTTEEEEEDECVDDWETVADALEASTNSIIPEKHEDSSSGDSYSGSVTTEEKEEDECVDDWETVADALEASTNSIIPEKHEETRIVSLAPELPNKVVEDMKAKVVTKGHAWTANDASRPHSLPNLAKSYTFPMSVERHCGHGVSPWLYQSITSQPTQCPICYEDLDLTDSSFLPCLCGFRVCLFCHKRILEADARCPGCRKTYDGVSGKTGINGGVPAFQFTQSLIMTTKF